jgi:hypothetical protein
MMSTVESAARVAPSPMITGPNARLEQAVEWEGLPWVPRELLIDGAWRAGPAGLALARVLSGAGLPPGVLNVAVSSRPDATDAQSTFHPAVAALS